VDTIIDFAAAEQFKVRTAGNADAANADVLAELAALVADGKLKVPVAEVFALDDVQKAFRSLEQRHTRGKIVLRP
jgi:NADPH:quinone reductase-like Zn-dependent oxidoreductase